MTEVYKGVCDECGKHTDSGDLKYVLMWKDMALCIKCLNKKRKELHRSIYGEG